MRVKKFISLLLCIVMVCTIVPVYSLAADIEISEPSVSEESAEEYAENQVVFLYTQTVNDKGNFCSEEKIPSELLECGISSVKEIPAGAVYDTEIKNNGNGTCTKSAFLIGYTSDGAEECLEKIEALDSVSDASFNYYFTEDAFSMPTEITRKVTNYQTYTQWWMEDSLHIPEAWEKHETLGEGSVVAVIDSGVYVNNPEIASNIWEDANGHRGFNAVTLSYDATPCTSHGGNVAGIIAAKPGNVLDLIGVAPLSKIMPICTSSSPSSTSTTVAAIVAAINYAIENGADVITMSLSTTTNITSVKNACDAAYNAGITVIASASNNGTSAAAQRHYPAAYSSVIGVMAYGPDNKLCYFSNWDTTGNYYEVAAPGYKILGLPMSEQNGSGTCISGTSQAAPIVASLAALYYSIYPDHTPDEFRNALLNACTDTVNGNSESGSGSYTFKKVDALKLLDYYDEETPCVEATPGTPTVVDEDNCFIYGLDEGYASIEDYVTVTNGDYEFIPTAIGNGTGSILRVYSLSGSVYKDYEIVIFGDTDGDALCDGMDCALCQFVMNGGATTPAVAFASDVNFDDAVTQDDVDIIAGCGIKADFVTQIR